MAPPKPKSIEDALAEFNAIQFPSSAEADDFFGRHGIGNTGGQINSPFERHLYYESLLSRLMEADGVKFSSMHKGTPLFFLAWTAFDMRSYETALSYLDSSFSEDVRNLSDWLTAPGARFLKLESEDHVAARTVDCMRDLLTTQFDRFNAVSGCAPITMEVWVPNFIEPMLSGTDAAGRSILAALYVFVFEHRHRVIEMALRADQVGSNHAVLSHLLLGGLVFESLLKRHYAGGTLGSVFRDQTFQGDFGLTAAPHSSANTLAEILADINATDTATAFCATARVRNATGHNLERDNVFSKPGALGILFDQVVNAILFVISRKWLP